MYKIIIGLSICKSLNAAHFITQDFGKAIKALRKHRDTDIVLNTNDKETLSVTRTHLYCQGIHNHQSDP